jgi:hypothetical protein
MEEKATRGPILTVFSILFALLAVSNFSKPLSRGRAGFVFFGTKTSGLANAVLGPAFGLFLVVYVIGIWRQKRWAVPMAWAYAAYVLINMTLFTIKTPQNWQAPLFAVIYMVIALGVSWGAAVLLTQHRAQLT